MIISADLKLKLMLSNMRQFFQSLNLKYGEVISIMNEGGEIIIGQYYGNFEVSSGTFHFYNHSNGQTEIVVLDNLQSLRRG